MRKICSVLKCKNMNNAAPIRNQKDEVISRVQVNVIQYDDVPIGPSVIGKKEQNFKMIYVQPYNHISVPIT